MLTDGQKKVLERTLEKFSIATGMSYVYRIDDDIDREVRGCLYSHEINGVGCAIGCHTDNDELTKKWDENKYSIDSIRENDRDEFERMFPELDPTDREDIEFLYELQNAHDYAVNLLEFQQVLGRWVREEAKPVW